MRLTRIIDSWGLMRLRESNGDSWDWGRILGTHETQKNYSGLMKLTRIIENHGDSWDSGRVMETHENHTHGDTLVSGILQRNHENLDTNKDKRDTWDSMRLLGTHETKKYYCGLWDTWSHSDSWRLMRVIPRSLPESNESPFVSLSLMRLQ